MINWDNYETYKRSELKDIVLEVADFVEQRLHNIRMGTDDGDLLTVLEEIERILQ